MDFLKEYNKKKDIIEKRIEKIFEEEKFESSSLEEIMKYAVLNGGKRIRPILFLSAFEMLGNKDCDGALDFACALEFIHCYSLVHDDLPAMDNDDLRRGKPTCHKKFSEYGAILAGDALLNYAFECMLSLADKFDLNDLVSAMKVIASSSGNKGMCAGQMADMSGETDDFSKLSKMYENKTGALLKAAVLGGYLLSGGYRKNEEAYYILEKFSRLLGLIFQIKDDLLDVESTDEILGKPVFSDEKNNKNTFVSEYGIKRCKELINDYKEEALALLSKLEYDTEFLKEITVFTAERNN